MMSVSPPATQNSLKDHRPVLTILKGDFSVTVPDGLPAECSEAGNCVIQWYWYATSNEQTYISCLDFELA